MTKVGLVEGGKRKYVLAPGLVKLRAEESAPFRRDAAAQAASE
jgi:lysozyme